MKNAEQKYIEAVERQLVVGLGLIKAIKENAPTYTVNMYRQRMNELNTAVRELQVIVNERHRRRTSRC